MYDYPQQGARKRRSPRRSSRQVPACLNRNPETTVVTILDPSLRECIDGATNGHFTRVHVSSVGEAVAAVREHSATALLLSASIARRQPPSEIAALVLKSPGITAVAVLGEDWPNAYHDLLQLGACGVRRVVNLAQRNGWNDLRALVEDAGSECTPLLHAEILSRLGGATDETRHFFAVLTRVAPETTKVKELAQLFAIEPSTLMSRFYRASLPAPKMYLSMTRLLYAASFLETPKVSVAAVADRLRFGSPQGFCRHVRKTLGLTAGQFRRELPLSAALEHYISRLILPYQATFSSFDPFGGSWILRTSSKLPDLHTSLVAI
jgi:AraC-like DNA-binding protein